MAEDDSLQDLIDAVSYGEVALPGLDEEFAELRARINLVSVVSPELGFPDLGFKGYRSFIERSLTAAEDPMTLNVAFALEEEVGGSRLKWLEEIVPRHWGIPDGPKIHLRYSMETEPAEGQAIAPDADVRLADLLDVGFHPFVCEGRVAVNLWLRDPKGNRIDSTYDWPTYRGSEYGRLREGLGKKFPEVNW